MILNRLIVPEGNHLIFTLNYKVGETEYELKPGESYYMSIAPHDQADTVIMNFLTNIKHFDFPIDISEGRYIFEIGIKGGVDGYGDRIILPSVDERHKPLNELIVLKKMGS